MCFKIGIEKGAKLRVTIIYDIGRNKLLTSLVIIDCWVVPSEPGICVELCSAPLIAWLSSN